MNYQLENIIGTILSGWLDSIKTYQQILFNLNPEAYEKLKQRLTKVRLLFAITKKLFNEKVFIGSFSYDSSLFFDVPGCYQGKGH